jgi:5-(carboxyamino)imidazole ribonucleotide mutase
LSAIAIIATVDDGLAAKLDDFRAQQTAAAQAMVLPSL